MDDIRIPFNRPCVVDTSLGFVERALASPIHAGDGTFTNQCQTIIEGELGVRKALLTTSCTHALEMAALLLDIRPGDEVIVPSFTFVSTANAFALRGARIVFADIRQDTLNIDETRVESLFSDRTRAIVPVHYAGVGCEMDTLTALAAQRGLRQRGVAVVEDNAHGLFGKWCGRPLGSFGVLATQSFHESKNFSCGEGGALIVNDPSLLDRAEIVREKGTNRSRFFRGQVDKYSWLELGSSYLLSDVLAALLASQLEQRVQIQARRHAIWKRYESELNEWAVVQGVRLPFVPSEADHTAHMFYLRMPSLDVRQRFIGHLRSRGILAVFHYLPLHLSDVGRGMGGRPGDCPVAEEVSDRIVRLPLYAALTEDEQDEVIAGVRAFRA